MNFDQKSNFYRSWSRVQSKIATTSLGWIPSPVGIALRNRLYRIIFAKMGDHTKICQNVQLTHTKLIAIGSEVTLRRGTELIAEPNSHIEISDRVLLDRDVRIVTRGEGSRVKLGKEVYFDRGVELKAHPGGEIEFGDRTYIGAYVCISAYGKLKIGSDCAIASLSSLFAHNHGFSNLNRTIREQEITVKGITIEDDCWLGSGVRVVDGVTIGKGSVIGAGAVVTKNIPPYSIAVGVPAQVIDRRKVEDLASKIDRELLIFCH